MRSFRLVSLCTSLLNIMVLAQSASVISQPLVPKSAVATVSSQPDSAMQGKIAESYGKLPLNFEANHGQADGRVKFLSRTGGYTLFLTADEAVLTLRGMAKNPAPKGASHFAEHAASLKRCPDTNHPDTNQKSSAGCEAVPLPAAAPILESTTESVTGTVLRMKLRNANPAAQITGTDKLTGTSNYFIGNNPTKWRTNVPTFAKVKYEEIYSGIDLVYYGNQRQLEYDFIVAPGADPRRIAFEVSGAKRIRRDARGDLVLQMETGEGEIRWHKPVVYQEKDGARQEIAGRYAITDKNRVGFELASYDASRPLYIDPLIYSTYLGGNGDEYGAGIAVDNAGNAYVIGTTNSTDFPVTPGALQTVCHGGSYGGTCGDAFVVKLNPTGSALVYSTYLGGNGYDAGSGIAVDSAGNTYVTGYTESTDFPTMNPLQPAIGGGGKGGIGNAFVTKIASSGSALIYSTYLGGSGSNNYGGDTGSGIAVDSAGNTYVTGTTRSTDFPTMNPLQPALNPFEDAFVTKINPSGSALVYSTYLGGLSGDGGGGIAVDSAGNAYITGFTFATNFPTKNPLQPVLDGVQDAFVTKINSTGSALVYSTYLGGSPYNTGSGVAVDGSGSAYVTGYTDSTNFPTRNPLQANYGGGDWDAFVTKINPLGSALVYSTYLGGRGVDIGYGIAVDGAGDACVTGSTSSPDFPTASALQKQRSKLIDAFVSTLNPTGSVLVYSTYLGGNSLDYGFGIAVDNARNAYVSGRTYSTDFRITPGAFETVCNGGSSCSDAFISKIDVRPSTSVALSSSLNPSTYGQAVTFTALVTSVLGAPPDGETVTFMKGAIVLGTRTLSGGSATLTTSTLPVGNNLIKAVYGGDANFLGSKSNTVNQVVNKATTTTTLASSLNPSNVGQSVTFTASVAPQFSGTVKGTVTFYDGATALKTVALSGGGAKFTTSTLTSGAHNIKATYNGNANFDGSSASLTQTVN